MRLLLVTVLFTLLLDAHGAAQQRPSTDKPQLHLGWGVDTTQAPVGEIFAVWHAYLADRPDSLHSSTYWLAEEQERFPDFDLTRQWIYRGATWFTWMRVTVLDIAPAASREDEYVIRTLFAVVDPQDDAIRPFGLARVYAVQENDRWALANALFRRTDGWQVAHVGPITYVYPPSYAFDHGRAEKAAAFVDSLATSFAVPALRNIDYYVARSSGELSWIIGLDYAIPGTTGRTYAANRLVLSTLGEFHAHELVHVVLEPIAPAASAPGFLVGGVATWLGGAMGKTFPEVMQEFAVRVASDTALTLDAVIHGRPEATGALRQVGAVLCQLAYERAGTEGVKELLATGRSGDEILATLERVLGVSSTELDRVWRTTVLAYRQ